MENKNIFDWFLRFIKGAVMGMDFVLPGISGAAFAVVLGLYEKIVEFIAHITKNFVKNLFFFIPVFCGIITGIYLVSHPMSFLLKNYQTPVLWFFIGTILGTMPDLWQKSKEKGRKPMHIAILILTFLLSAYFLLFFGDKTLGHLMLNTTTAFFSGAAVAFIGFVPGFSSSTFLVLLGLYDQMINAVKVRDINVIIPFAIGLAVFIFPFSRGIEFLLKNVFAGFFHVILGFVLASVVLIADKASHGYDYLQIDAISCVVTLVCGTVFSYWMCKLSRKYEG